MSDFGFVIIGVSLFLSSLTVLRGLVYIARAIIKLADVLHIINTHGLHVRNYTGDALVVNMHLDNRP